MKKGNTTSHTSFNFVDGFRQKQLLHRRFPSVECLLALLLLPNLLYLLHYVHWLHFSSHCYNCYRCYCSIRCYYWCWSGILHNHFGKMSMSSYKCHSLHCCWRRKTSYYHCLMGSCCGYYLMNSILSTHFYKKNICKNTFGS